ncbi:MAG: helix-turn-helix domain-containing protein [Bdellovibrionales bacterium]|nr:helix-turn-helix domain-containing protein [Bdellovibrionales bacterium]
MSEYLSYDEASQLLGIEKGTLYSWVNRCHIPHFRIAPRMVRFSKKELEEWVQSHRVGSHFLTKNYKNGETNVTMKLDADTKSD